MAALDYTDDCSGLFFPLIFWLSRVQNSVLQLVQFYFWPSPFYKAKNGPESVLSVSRAYMQEGEHFWSKKHFSMSPESKDRHFWGPLYIHSVFWLVPKNCHHNHLGRGQISWKFGPPTVTFLFLQEGLKKCYRLIPKTPGGRGCVKNWLFFDTLIIQTGFHVRSLNPLNLGYEYEGVDCALYMWLHLFLI